GISDFGLAARAILPRQEAAQYINDYLNRYEGVRRYVEETKRQAAQLGYVTTLLGRRRYLPEIRAPHHALRAAAERAAINAPLQGTAADLMKLAMVQVDRAMQQQGLRSRMILQVHDELLFEVPKDEVEALEALVRDIMESVYPLSVPLNVDIKVGRNWGELD
ncbi:MAG: DNA polymerase I, partial [Chloroflexi bacterium]|nr:DNA polymerase I [Chloroflexota bacterium]